MLCVNTRQRLGRHMARPCTVRDTGKAPGCGAATLRVEASGSIKEPGNLRVTMALSAANVRLIDLALHFGAVGINDHFASKAEKALDYPAAQLHVLAGIGTCDAGHRTIFANIGNPRLAGRLALNQLADLLVAATIKIGVVVTAFLSVGSTHNVIIH